MDLAVGFDHFGAFLVGEAVEDGGDAVGRTAAQGLERLTGLEADAVLVEQAVEQVLERHNIDVLVEPQGVLHSSTDLPNVTNEVTQIFDSLN